MQSQKFLIGLEKGENSCNLLQYWESLWPNQQKENYRTWEYRDKWWSLSELISEGQIKMRVGGTTSLSKRTDQWEFHREECKSVNSILEEMEWMGHSLQMI